MWTSSNFIKIAFGIVAVAGLCLYLGNYKSLVLGGRAQAEKPSVANGSFGTPDKLTITMLEIGHGDAILLQDGKKNVLVDTGHKANRQLVLQGLQKLGVRRIDTIILTHHHADHIGNIFPIASRYGVEKIHHTGLHKEDNPISLKLKEAFANKLYKEKLLKAGDKLKLSRDMRMEVLSPGEFLPEGYRSHFNNASLVTKLYYKDFTMLFTGDVEQPTDTILTKKYGSKLEADVLKVPHHAVKGSNSHEFLAAVKPKYAVISCSDLTHLHHPKKSIIKDLKGLGAKVYTTRDRGTITIVTDGKGVEITTSK